MAAVLRANPSKQREWRGDPLNGQPLTVWNDVGMGDAFQFVRYTLPLLQRGEKVRFAVAASQIALFATISPGSSRRWSTVAAWITCNAALRSL